MKKRVLLVDDEKDILMSMKMVMESRGFEAITASAAEPALSLLRREKFDLLIIDLLMPKVNGAALLKEIRADPVLKHLKVAVLTVVRRDEPQGKELAALKPDEYFSKPIDLKDFDERIKRLLK